MNTPNNRSSYTIVGQYRYKQSDLLGQGYSSKVYKAYHSVKKFQAALKIIQVDKIHEDVNKILLESELRCLESLKGTLHVLNLLDVVKSQKFIYVITELCKSDLAIVGNRKYEEREAWSYIKQIIKGYSALYKKGILHRDIKPQNMFIKTDTHIKLGDFGFATTVPQAKKQHNYNIGSPSYMSPQVLHRNEYSPASDIWSIGVSYYELLTGRLPWPGTNEKQLKSQITRYGIKDVIEGIDRVAGTAISERSKEFLRECLVYDAWGRITVEELVEFQVFEKGRGGSYGSMDKYSESTISSLHHNNKQNLCSSDNIMKYASNNPSRHTNPSPESPQKQKTPSKVPQTPLSSSPTPSKSPSPNPSPTKVPPSPPTPTPKKTFTLIPTPVATSTSNNTTPAATNPINLDKFKSTHVSARDAVNWGKKKVVGGQGDADTKTNNNNIENKHTIIKSPIIQINSQSSPQKQKSKQKQKKQSTVVSVPSTNPTPHRNAPVFGSSNTNTATKKQSNLNSDKKTNCNLINTNSNTNINVNTASNKQLNTQNNYTKRYSINNFVSDVVSGNVNRISSKGSGSSAQDISPTPIQAHHPTGTIASIKNNIINKGGSNNTNSNNNNSLRSIHDTNKIIHQGFSNGSSNNSHNNGMEVKGIAKLGSIQLELQAGKANGSGNGRWRQSVPGNYCSSNAYGSSPQIYFRDGRSELRNSSKDNSQRMSNRQNSTSRQKSQPPIPPPKKSLPNPIPASQPPKKHKTSLDCIRQQQFQSDLNKFNQQAVDKLINGHLQLSNLVYKFLEDLENVEAGQLALEEKMGGTGGRTGAMHFWRIQLNVVKLCLKNYIIKIVEKLDSLERLETEIEIEMELQSQELGVLGSNMGKLDNSSVYVRQELAEFGSKSELVRYIFGIQYNAAEGITLGSCQNIGYSNKNTVKLSKPQTQTQTRTPTNNPNLTQSPMSPTIPHLQISSMYKKTKMLIKNYRVRYQSNPQLKAYWPKAKQSKYKNILNSCFSFLSIMKPLLPSSSPSSHPFSRQFLEKIDYVCILIEIFSYMVKNKYISNEGILSITAGKMRRNFVTGGEVFRRIERVERDREKDREKEKEREKAK